MSLHLGNLPPRIRKDELERIFGRFGKCSVRLKDGYGFAVYDFHGDAEAALRALQGRRICGQAIDLSWSNKQPKPLQRFEKTVKFQGMIQHGRNSERNANHVGHNFSVSHGGRPKPTGIHKGRASFNHNRKDVEYYNEDGEFIKESDQNERNNVNTSRRGEEDNNFRDGNGNGDDADEKMGSDRYEPDCVDDRIKEYDEKHDMGHLADYPDNTRDHQTCFTRRAAGHEIRDCSLKQAKTRAHNEVGGPESRSRERLQLRNRYPGSARQHETYRRNGTVHKSLVENESNQTKKMNYDGLKRRGREDQSVGINDSRRSTSSHFHSGSLEPLSGSGSHSGSRSPLPYSLSRSSRSRSRSRSHTRSPYLSESHGQTLPSSPPNDERDNLNDSLNNPRSREVLSEINKLFEPDDREESIGTEALIETQQLDYDSGDKDPISANYSDASDKDTTAEELSVEKQRVAEDFENIEGTKVIKSMEPVQKSDRILLSIPAKELNRVLKHYGLKHPDENGQLENVEDYFGSARLWPWEMIYYRRYKKGPVLEENYARRVAQNTAFGMVDKYIRSSSGWYESNEELP